MQGQPGQQVLGFRQCFYGHRILWMLASVTLEPLTRLRQEVGGTDGIAQTHVDCCLIVEQTGRQQHRASIDESMTALLQLIEGMLQHMPISYLVTDPGGDRCELLYDLRWGVVRQRRLGRLKRSQGLLQRKGGAQQGPVPLQAPLFEQELGAEQRTLRRDRGLVEQRQRLLG